MSADEKLTLEQTAALWALDFDVCELNQHGTTEECLVVADYELICAHCDHRRPLCQRHAAATVQLINRPDAELMPVWKCERCHRRSFDFHKVFHLHIVGGHHHA